MLQPSDVAAAVLQTIKRPRFEVAMPGYIGSLTRRANVLPGPLREMVFRRFVPNQVSQVNRGARASYEAQFDEHK